MAANFESDTNQSTLAPDEVDELTVNNSPCRNGCFSSSQFFCHLTCIICQEVFKNPVTANCGHTFCMGCLKGRAAMQRESTAMFACPTCREEINLTDLSKLKINRAMVDLISELKGEIACSSFEALNNPLPEYCDVHPGEKAEYLCATCVIIFCKTCKSFDATDHEPNKHIVYRLDTLDFKSWLETLDVKAKVQKLKQDIKHMSDVNTTAINAVTEGLDGKLTDLKNYFLEVLERKMLEIRQSRHTSKALHEWNQRIAELVKIESLVQKLDIEVAELDLKESKAVRNRTKKAMEYLKTLDKARFHFEMLSKDLKQFLDHKFVSMKERAAWETSITDIMPQLYVNFSLKPPVFRSAFLKKVKARRIMEFINASHYDLKHADWVKNYLFAIDKMKNAAVCISTNEPSVRTLYSRKTSDCMISRLCGSSRASNRGGCNEKCTFDYAVKLVTRKVDAVDTILIRKVAAIGEDMPGSDFTETYDEINECEIGPSKLLWPYFYYLKKDGFYRKDLRVKNKVSLKSIRYAEDFIICSNHGEYEYAVIKLNKQKMEIWDDKWAYSSRTYSLDLPFLQEVTYMTGSANNSDLWIIDGQLRVLLCFSPMGNLLKAFEIDIKGKICGLNARQDQLIILSVCEDDKGVFWGIPFSLLC